MMSTVPLPAGFFGLPWYRQWLPRIRRDFWLKTVGITIFIWLFFVAYFWLLRNPQFPVTVMPLTAIDDAIAFAPGWLPFYLTLWFYVTIPPSLIVDRRQLVRYGIAAFLLCATGLLIFLLWPTAVPAGLVDREPEAYSAFAFLKGIDAAGNACPSLHVATAVFSAIMLDRQLRTMGGGWQVRTGNGLWCAAIVYSTLATKQHVLHDAVGGALLGIGGALLSLSWLNRRTPGLR